METNLFKILLWKWWRGIDRQFLIAIGILIFFSVLLVTAASGSVAARIGVHEDFFSSRHLVYMVLCVLCIVGVSNLPKESILKLGVILFAVNIILLILVKFYGYEIKGARRWINLAGFSVQPSEFIKPAFAIIVAYIFTTMKNRNLAFFMTFLIFALVAGLIILQPDLGMVVTIIGIWGAQTFIAGMPIIWMVCGGLIVCIGIFIAYNFLPHVAVRINSFLDPESYENYQVSKSLAAFHTGGLFGKGPGEGVVKSHIPDSHADFIFAVAGEEYGIVICIFISLVFAFIVIKTILSIAKKHDEFSIIVCTGIIGQFGLQSIINMCVALNLLPTKGMTLPFISYGGSATIGAGIGAGILLALSKNDVNFIKYDVLNK
ncbi:MAG: putative peptidoglycan glycosyltransferase FtsW [Rickettsiaceae bacterium]|nr:putative peptidoglycan glycosyltransferase FtsW [Rickettsiaceae bacterium]